MKKWINEFKKFAIKGNVIDMAIGVIIGGAFGKIVTSLVNDVIMPMFGLILGGLDFKELSITFRDTNIAYGMFLQQIIDFLIIAICIFFFMKIANKLKVKEEAKPEPEVVVEPKDILLLEEIRDLLKEQHKPNKKNKSKDK
ncbi:MAG: large-conductance mechanosensitive channel protein MscL [Bacilli bacterium]|nr:large-conductance mechanosensitive channel protein MscL [Bacilli bacterium]MDD4608205.1 large-conductance mechanosensitive channel protein MscL [Bacilli bacterium]